MPTEPFDPKTNTGLVSRRSRAKIEGKTVRKPAQTMPLQRLIESFSLLPLSEVPQAYHWSHYWVDFLDPSEDGVLLKDCLPLCIIEETLFNPLRMFLEFHLRVWLRLKLSGVDDIPRSGRLFGPIRHSIGSMIRSAL